MTHTIEQLKTILDNGGRIESTKGFHAFRSENNYLVADPSGNCMAYAFLDHAITNPSDWQEVKKEDPFDYEIKFVPYSDFIPPLMPSPEPEPKVLTMDLNGTKYVCVPVEVYKVQQAELDNFRSGFIDKLLGEMEKPTPEQEEWFRTCQSCGTETQFGSQYCENCHNEIIGMS